ncbi:MAG: transposase, partial [Proteobacteria bacterium]|nr:transposase [Pseudomonadota bacterium]
AIVHISIQRTHVHLIVEASRAHDLARGLQGFQISAARRINRALGRAGQVFADRYHATPLTSPRQVRNTLAYVLNNWRHHGEDKRPVAARWTKDPFSSATSFDGWREPITPPPATYEPPRMRAPRTWLLTTGWRRHRLIALAEVPGGSHAE